MLVELWQITPDAERLIERAARVSHRSEPSRTIEETRAFIRRLIRLGHESVLEHAVATFYIDGISRVCSHQLVRHRLCSFTQESQRFVECADEWYVPGSLRVGPAKDVVEDIIESAYSSYRKLVDLGIPREDARYVLPGAMLTRLVMTANFRELRHIIRLRASPQAQEEIRALAKSMLLILMEHAPSCFEDLYQELGEGGG